MDNVSTTKDMPLALVVDDEIDAVHILTSYLNSIGFETLMATNGQEGEMFFREYRPQLVVSDIHMPIQNGLILLEKIKSESPDTVVILITGYYHYEQLIRHAPCPPDGFFVKPFELSALLESIRTAFKNARNRSNKRKFLIGPKPPSDALSNSQQLSP